MKKDSLIRTNPYLKNKALREKLLLISVNSSIAIEGVKIKVTRKDLQKYKRAKHINIGRKSETKKRRLT